MAIKHAAGNSVNSIFEKSNQGFFCYKKQIQANFCKIQ